MAGEELEKPHKHHPYSPFYNRLFDKTEKAKAEADATAVGVFRQKIEAGKLPSTDDTAAMINSAQKLGEYLALREVLVDFTEIYSGKEVTIDDIIDKPTIT